MENADPVSNDGAEHRAKKSLGQNFLVDPNLQRIIVSAIEAGPEDEVLEIGPGTGALTRHLAGGVRRLVLVELDDMLAAKLAARYEEDPAIQVVRADILKTRLSAVLEDPGSAKVIGNIPYNITTPIIFHLLDALPRPSVAVLMVQREVADRILAHPGGKTYGALSVGVQALAGVERIIQVGRGAFRPAPEVDSTVLRIRPHAPPVLDPSEERALRRLTRAAFSRRRKQFQRVLRDEYGLDPARIREIETRTGFDLTARPERFSPAEFIELTRHLKDPEAEAAASDGGLTPSG